MVSIATESTFIRELPKKIFIEPTCRCNSKCQMCERTFIERKDGDLSFKNFIKILQNFDGIDEISLQGVGEPLLNKDFFRMIEYCKSNRMKVSFNTNASMLTKKIANCLIKLKVDELRISYDGGSSQTFEAIRKGLSYKHVTDNIIQCSNVRKRLQSSLPKLTLTITAMKKNLKELPSIVEFAYKNSIDCIEILNLYVFDRGLAIKENSLKNLDKTLVDEILCMVKEKCQVYNIKYEGPILVQQELKDKCLNCSWSWSGTYITYDGFVTPCCVISNPIEFNLGNVFQTPFKKIWNSDKYRDIRKEILSGNIPPVCKKCYDSGHILPEF